MKIQLGIIIGVFFLIFSYAQTPQNQKLQNGDLLFVGTDMGNLSGAINRVTQTSKATNFSHVGIVEIDCENTWILHASPKGGSQKQTLASFVEEALEEKSKIITYRLKDEFQATISEALKLGNQMLGKPYNFSYILSETSYYCSDYIERIFRKNSIFTLEPMTFINPKTKKFDEVWVDFYKQQNLDIPEGLPGCNPNGLANSDKIIELWEIK